MLKLNKNQVKPGQKIEFDKVAHFSSFGLETEEEHQKHLEALEKRGGKDWRKYFGKFEPGDIVEISKLSGTNATLKFDNGTNKFEFHSWWSEIKKFTTLGSQENLGENTVEYVIFYNGKKWKPKKYKDMGKIKASMMDAMGYQGMINKLAKHYQYRSPEVYGSMAHWDGLAEYAGSEDFSKFEVYEWSNRKLGKKVDFDAVKYRDELKEYAAITAQFGSAVRDLYKKFKDDDTYKYILCFVHEDYRNSKYPYYEGLKESDIIKNVMKTSGVKGTRKSTKMGKTAIAFKKSIDMYNVAKLLEEDTYYVLDMTGSELEEKDGDFIVMESRKSKIEELLKSI